MSRAGTSAYSPVVWSTATAPSPPRVTTATGTSSESVPSAATALSVRV